MACSPLKNNGGFTLVELMVGLAVAGILAAMVASVLGQNILSSEALIQRQGADEQKTTLRRMLLRDLKNMEWGTIVNPEAGGFSLITSHNTLVSAPLPVNVDWKFDQGKIIRSEHCTELSYSRTQVLSDQVEYFSLDFFSSAENQWISSVNWLRRNDLFYPGAIRLQVRIRDMQQFEIIEGISEHASL